MDYAAEAFDQMQLLWGAKGFNDHQLHCVLRFERGLDAEILRRAVMGSIEAFPILGTRYVGGARPRWTSLDQNDYEPAFIVVQSEAEFETFLVSPVDEQTGPQVRVCYLNSKTPSIAVKMNHMICDAADFKAYLYSLAEIHTRLDAGERYQARATTADRSLRCVLKRFPFAIRLRSLLLQSRENNRCGQARFPLTESGHGYPFIVARKLSRERAAALKEQGAATRATLNDVVLTGLYRCLSRRLALAAGTCLSIPIMVDMRRYLATGRGLSSLTNLTSTVSTQLKCRHAEPFQDTLRRVKAVMDSKKRSNFGLNGFIKLDRVYRIFGSSVANRLLRSVLKNPLISMTNMGVLDSSSVQFADQRPCNAFLCGSVKHKPYFQVAVSSYEGEMTFCVSLLGSDGDRDRIVSFMDALEADLSNWQRCDAAVLPENIPAARIVRWLPWAGRDGTRVRPEAV